MTLHVIMACHNRRELTVRAVARMREAADAAGMPVDFTVFDDGCTDGTGDALRQHDGVRILAGDGTAYWAKGMASAEAAVLREADGSPALSGSAGTPTSRDPGWIVWMNDDICLDPDALCRARMHLEQNPGAILVGSTRDPSSGVVTYGGMERAGRHPLRVRVAQPPAAGPPAPVTTFNGNLVFVPMTAARMLGGIDGGFAHGLADIDYGWRARRGGMDVLLLPGTFATCPRNLPPPAVSLWASWSKFLSVKGGAHPASTRRILRRLAPATWPAWWASTYVLWWVRALRGSVAGAGKGRGTG